MQQARHSTAATAAYSQCQDYLDALMVYLEGNRNYLIRYVEEHFPTASITRPAVADSADVAAAPRDC